jgi:cytochrome oxidase Cu insertion factor (SCO1/SenC/PrrC family)
LRNYDGRRVDQNDLRRRIVVLTFLDSQCTDTCPILASQIGQVIASLPPADRDEVIAVAISTDPSEDTPRAVREFLEQQRALGKLLYLSGPETDMRTLWKRFQIFSSLESGKDTLHSAPVRIYDRDGVWVATLHAGVDLTEANLLHDIRAALAADGETSE